MPSPRLGLMFYRSHPPEWLPDFSRMVEAAGLDEVWVVEDAFFNGGISAASVALSVTDRITVGIGIIPAVVRNPAYTAMEIATLARIFPGRLQVGIGHGVADWIRQVGEFPRSQLGALEETAVAVRNLLHGREVSLDGSHVHLEKVRLVHPPEVPPGIWLGVTGPKSLALSGRIADGTILVELTGPTLIRKNREMIGGDGGHEIALFSHWSQDGDGDKARADLRPVLAERIADGGMRELVAPGFAREAQTLLDRGGVDHLAAGMPEAWLDEIAVAGTPAQCLATINQVGNAGATRVVLVPPAGATIEQLAGWCAELAAARKP
jgi:5,10-methylenetetrahydromethanopterin reductase